ncbi:MAG: hypothetical protein DMF60_12085 [Acidobacteria bacterium]|nr:MAG: hypothetical protein DMF60_12085 [Acidobacteriota bacterium]
MRFLHDFSLIPDTKISGADGAQDSHQVDANSYASRHDQKGRHIVFFNETRNQGNDVRWVV